MPDIKSAREIAMEKVEKMGEPTEEERLGWKYVPEGEKLALKYLKKDCNLVSELGQYQDKVKKYIIAGAGNILIRNIGLPRNDSAKKDNRRVMDGLKVLKSDKVGVENVYSKIRHIFKHYVEQGEQQRKGAYESLKTEFTAKLQQAMQQQLGLLTRVNLDVEKRPQFQEEWRKVLLQLDAPYLKLLAEYKQELANIA